MKKIKEYFSLIDDQGLVSGKEVWFYPYGTTSHGTMANEVTGKPGEYVIEIDPSGDNAKISKYYDIWYDGIRQYEKITLKDKWEWHCNKSANSQTINFADCNDENGQALPTTIPHAKLEFSYYEKGRMFSVTDITDTYFIVQASEFSDNEANLPINIQFKVSVGEA